MAKKIASPKMAMPSGIGKKMSGGASKPKGGGSVKKSAC